jgi:hypothetical protein
MPMGETVEELEQSSPVTKQLAVYYGVERTDRLHVRVWGALRGV